MFFPVVFFLLCSLRLSEHFNTLSNGNSSPADREESCKVVTTWLRKQDRFDGTKKHQKLAAKLVTIATKLMKSPDMAALSIEMAQVLGSKLPLEMKLKCLRHAVKSFMFGSITLASDNVSFGFCYHLLRWLKDSNSNAVTAQDLYKYMNRTLIKHERPTGDLVEVLNDLFQQKFPAASKKTSGAWNSSVDVPTCRPAKEPSTCLTKTTRAAREKKMALHHRTNASLKKKRAGMQNQFLEAIMNGEGETRAMAEGVIVEVENILLDEDLSLHERTQGSLLVRQVMDSQMMKEKLAENSMGIRHILRMLKQREGKQKRL